jgi:hypothetical protein
MQESGDKAARLRQEGNGEGEHEEKRQNHGNACSA